MSSTTQSNTANAISEDILTAEMPRRQLGAMDWEASLLTLGGVKWEQRCSEAEAIQLIHRAIELGVNTFDTAVAYGNGESERRLGLALEGRRDDLWINTKTTKRDADEAKRDIDGSLQRLRTDRIDLMFVHGLDDDDDYQRVLDDHSVLRTIEEYQKAGHIRYVGVSGHWYKHNTERILDAYPLDAILVPVGLFNEAYGYSYFDTVIPKAREKDIAVLGMKIFGAGRVAHTADIEPYLRFAIHQPIDTAVIGCDSVAQLEQTVGIIKRRPAALPDGETKSLHAEAREVTQTWDAGEFNWVKHYL